MCQACPQLSIQTTIRGVLSYLLSVRAALDYAVNCELYTLGALTAHINISTPDAICSLIVHDKLATSCWTENLRDPSQGHPKSARSTYDHLIPDTTTTRFGNLSAVAPTLPRGFTMSDMSDPRYSEGESNDSGEDDIWLACGPGCCVSRRLVSSPHCSHQLQLSGFFQLSRPRSFAFRCPVMLVILF